MYSGYGLIFDCVGFWSFDNDFASHVIIFGVDNSSSSHADNRDNNVLVPVKVNLLVLMEVLLEQRKRLV